MGGDPDAVNPILRGTKAAVWQVLDLAAGETRVVRLMLIESGVPTGPFDERFDRLVDTRRAECATFYQRLVHRSLGDDAASIQRQAFAGLVWSRQ